tara:strand:- start:198 stop:1052 length:855 start_codon:yes stop_codon:yes gene_type:complete
MSKQLRRWWLGLNTLFGSQSHGYYIPSKASVYDSRSSGELSYQHWRKKINEAVSTQVHWLRLADRYESDLRKIDGTGTEKARWTQDWFPRLDAAMLYSMVRHFKPKRIIEIGVGHSTRFVARAIYDEGIEAVHIAIDPEPRKEVPQSANLCWIAKPVQLAGNEIWGKVASRDIVSIDSSHILMPGSDVDFLFNEIVPTLAAGVIVHVHDIFLPDDYPSEWHWRGYNEQCAVASFLGASNAELMFSSHFVSHYLKATFLSTEVAKLPLQPQARESSIWFRIASRE